MAMSARFQVQHNKLWFQRIHWSTFVFIAIGFILLTHAFIRAKQWGMLWATVSALSMPPGLIASFAYFCYQCVPAEQQTGLNLLKFPNDPAVIRRIVQTVFYISLIVLVAGFFPGRDPIISKSAWLGMTSSMLYLSHAAGDLFAHPHRIMIYVGLSSSIVFTLLQFMLLTIR